MRQSGTLQNLQAGSISGFGEGRCVFSNLKLLEKEDASSPLSLKIVFDGQEKYKVENGFFKVQRGQVLLVNSGESVVTEIRSSKSTKGICIYPPQDLIKEVFSVWQNPLEQNLDQKSDSAMAMRFTTRLLRMEEDGGLTQYLRSNFQSLLSFKANDDQKWLNFYCGLAEHMAQDQLNVEASLQRFASVKRQTREELFRRLLKARDFIHDHKFEAIDLDALTQISTLSKYHFLRSFKSVFSYSPYQYLLQLKLREARNLIEKGHSYNESAALVGYSDGANLRKALTRKA